jgi:hypothetical protein
MTERSVWNRPVSLRSVLWLAAAAVLVMAVARGTGEVSPWLLLAVGGLIGVTLVLAITSRPGQRRDDDQPTDDTERVRLAELEERLLDQGALEQRLLELEERLDFAERLLAERHDDRIEGPRS